MSEFKKNGEFATTWVGGLGLIQGEEIVRCRVCKYRYGCLHLVDNGDDDMRRCDATPDGFCSWGRALMKPSEYWNDNRTEREFEESGLQCCTRTMDFGHRCGYVALPKGHPLFGKDWDRCYDIAPELEVDGGITFANGTDDTWILGWDAAHAWHRRDWSIASDEFRALRDRHPELYGDFDWPGDSYIVDADMAERETRHFARQLAKLRGEREGE